MKIEKIIDYLKNYDGRPMNFMEVCGSHTASIEKNGIKSMLSPKIKLISGPGCPVCVTPTDYIDKICELSKENVITSFGDMIRVPGSRSSLMEEKGRGADIRMLYSPLDLIDIAKKESEKNFIFAAVGFETTTPLYALLIDSAVKENIKNIKLLTSLKTMPQAIKYVSSHGTKIDGFIAPGHVSVITGAKEYEKLAKETDRPFCISGFEPEQILASIYFLVKSAGKAVMENLYKSVVTYDGNKKARDIVNKYFKPCGSVWRGIGRLENSGMILKDEYKSFDAGSFGLDNDNINDKKCRCGDILTGRAEPDMCPYFGKKCTPENPVGACMVSYEGACFQSFQAGIF